MPPTGGETGKRNANLILQLAIWNQQAKLGEVFDSSTGYKLPNGANRSPDVSWIQQERWDSLTSEQKEKFIPLAPDFVLELMSPTDYLVNTQAKMQEYLENKVKLGWLINPQAKQVEIYRLEREVELLNSPQFISGEDVLPGFVLDLTGIF
jgi:Uma2 family endonuclease